MPKHMVAIAGIRRMIAMCDPVQQMSLITTTVVLTQVLRILILVIVMTVQAIAAVMAVVEIVAVIVVAIEALNQ